MSPSPQLAPPGTSTYNSATMHVGDGTWDAGRDDFLLPNLVGLNYPTMRYNGMGNRFFGLAGYKSLITAHGILAAIAFLLLIPAAVFARRFGGRNPRQAARTHIWLQITSLFVLTAVIILGFFAVGPERSLTNPHHGIGVAIYVLFWLQIIGGALVHSREKKVRRYHVPLPAMFHHWLGRIIALLGIAQVALGLTLWGSPLYLFVLYTLWMIGLVIAYFVFEWLAERRRGRVAGGDGYVQEEVVEERPGGSGGFGKLAAGGLAGAGLASLFNRRNNRRRRASESDITRTSGSSLSYDYDEKPAGRPAKTGWGKRILEIGAVGGALAGAKSLFGRRKQKNDEGSFEPYRTDGAYSDPYDSRSRVDQYNTQGPSTGGMNAPLAAGAVGAGAGAATTGRPMHPLAQPPMTAGSAMAPSEDDYSYYDDYMSASPSRRGRHQTFRQAVAAGGTMYAVRSLFNRRKENKEEQRAEGLRQQRLEEERIQRQESQRRKYTGDGISPPRQARHNRMDSRSDLSTITPVQQRPGTTATVIPPNNGPGYRAYPGGSPQHHAGAVSAMSGIHDPGLQSRAGGVSSASIPLAPGTAGLAASSALADRNRIRPVGQDPVIAMPGPNSSMPPVPPAHDPSMMSSGSEIYTSASGAQRHRHHVRNDVAMAGAGVAGLGAGAAASHLAEQRRRHDEVNTNSLESPPVSIHVQTQDNGRKVTLRRLTEEEAAAQRAARRNSRRARRNSEFGSGSEGEILGAGSNWQRTERMEAAQEAGLHNSQTPVSALGSARLHSSSPMQFPTPPPPGSQAHYGLDPQTGHAYTAPPPPPIPSSSQLGGRVESITSPATETSGGASEYANNRRRRRAERAQAKLAREGRTSGPSVDFT